jgi:Arc/MetJ family transcription regulator
VAVTSVNIPTELLERAMQVLGARTKREAIVTSLEEVVRRSEQTRALDALAGMTSLAELADPEVRAQARR